jgi:preprotein translocase subunit SecA
MSRFWRLFSKGRQEEPDALYEVRRRWTSLAALTDQDLKTAGHDATTLPEVVAATAEVARRVLRLELFDVQLQAALALARGSIVEMKTGAGKTLAAVPAIVWNARGSAGVHVLTANDYLARRDAEWMGGIYAFLGLSVGVIQQGMAREDRQAAYRSDVTYATATEAGFDLLRDQLARHPEEQVHRPFAAAVIDEADMVLIDEARIPLVIAGGALDPEDLATRAELAVRALRPGLHYAVDSHGRDVALTDLGIHEVERHLRCSNLFESPHHDLFTAVQNALHARALLKRDVDYVVKDDAVLSVDELKGRVVADRRWPAALQTALEAKEGVARHRQGRVLCSITLQNLVALYPQVCGMTGTAGSQRSELREIYGLEVEVLPTHRPVVRVDHPDVFAITRAEKNVAVLAEIRSVHASGRPVLVGTASVEESERLSHALADVAHHVLNARNEETEAATIARAGDPGAVTLSTNMAGRGVDIRLGPGVAERGGLHVIGTNRHESRRIDDQLRGRAGRQGDPGSSRFFVSAEDDLFAKHAEPGLALAADELQRVTEGRSLDLRLFLQKYESVVEGQRQQIQSRRQAVLTGAAPYASETERLATLAAIDDLWAEHLGSVTELREGTVWLALGGREPLHDYLTRVHELFLDLERHVEDEAARRLAAVAAGEWDPSTPGATWTYLTTDQPFGSMTVRAMKGFRRMVRGALSSRGRRGL